MHKEFEGIINEGDEITDAGVYTAKVVEVWEKNGYPCFVTAVKGKRMLIGFLISKGRNERILKILLSTERYRDFPASHFCYLKIKDNEWYYAGIGIASRFRRYRKKARKGINEIAEEFAGRVKLEQEKVMNNLLDIVEEIKENFNNVSQRKKLLAILKDRLDELWEISPNGIKKIALRLENTVKNVNLDKLTKEQAETLVTVFETLKLKKENSKHQINLSGQNHVNLMEFPKDIINA